MTAESRYAFQCMLGGSVGFGVGGAVAGSLFLDPDSLLFPLGMAVMGAAGGACLGLRERGWQKGPLLAIASGVGFALGCVPLLLTIAMVVTESAWSGAQIFGAALGLLLFGGAQGLIGTLTILLVLRRWQRSGWPILLGTIGFGIGAEFSLGIAAGLPPGLTQTIWGAVAGGALGLGLGRQKIEVDSQSMTTHS